MLPYEVGIRHGLLIVYTKSENTYPRNPYPKRVGYKAFCTNSPKCGVKTTSYDKNIFAAAYERVTLTKKLFLCLSVQQSVRAYVETTSKLLIT